jgi:hypothetical protein
MESLLLSKRIIAQSVNDSPKSKVPRGIDHLSLSFLRDSKMLPPNRTELAQPLGANRVRFRTPGKLLASGSGNGARAAVGRGNR